jgi:predicted secreted hydrolase/GMP synthase-like glutamine amidotransferase
LAGSPSFAAPDEKDASDVRVGTGDLFAGWDKFTAASPPVVALISTQAIDELREEAKKPGGSKKILQLRARIEELSGLPCLVVHYTQIKRLDLDKPNVKAIVLTAWKVMKNVERRQEIAGLIRETKVPLIAFCGGFHQLYLAYGGKSDIMRRLKPGETDPNPKYMPGLYKEWGIGTVRIVKRDPILDGLPDEMLMPERHYAQCVVLPDVFDLLASSDECRVQMIKHKSRLVYGTQFHPEIYDAEHLHGQVLLRNFLRLAGAGTAPAKQPAGSPVAKAQRLAYPYRAGKLSFPEDEGKHAPTQWPMTLIEWYAHYAHLTAEDGSRYFLFSTLITYDPIEPLLRDKFPHVISTLVDVSNAKTYHYRDMRPLKAFAAGHADARSAAGDYFKWKGAEKPFQYDFHVAWRDAEVDFALTTELTMTKPPLIVNGTGYIQLPKGDSGYYSQTRVRATGHLTINGATKKVTGIQWIDRQWLGATFVGSLHYSYDWWSLQLDNQEEAILFRIWNSKTDTIAMWRLEINHADGQRQHVEKFTLSDLPSGGWQLSAPAAAWDLKILPACKDQKVWQSCNITGTVHGQPVTGVAAAEMARDVAKEYAKVLFPQD